MTRNELLRPSGMTQVRPALTNERLQLTCLSSSRTRALSQGSPVKTSPLPTANIRTNSVTTATLLQPPSLPQLFSFVTAGIRMSLPGSRPNDDKATSTTNDVRNCTHVKITTCQRDEIQTATLNDEGADMAHIMCVRPSSRQCNTGSGVNTATLHLGVNICQLQQRRPRHTTTATDNGKDKRLCLGNASLWRLAGICDFSSVACTASHRGQAN